MKNYLSIQDMPFSLKRRLLPAFFAGFFAGFFISISLVFLYFFFIK